MKDKVQEQNRIKQVVRHEKNVNKNSVAEKAIQELEEELVMILSVKSIIEDITLAKVVHP